MNTLSDAEAIQMSTVLEDTVDQLVILGRVMPVPFHERPDAAQVINDDVAHVVDTQKQLETSFKDLANLKQPSTGAANVSSTDVQKAGADLRNNAAVFAFSLSQNPLATDNLDKVQADRAFLERVLYDTLMEMRNSCTFQALADAVGKEKDEQSQMEDVILKEEESRQQVRLLQKQIVDVRRERDVELQKRSEMTAHLKDQLQELKAKTAMEGKYVKKVCDVSIGQTQKRCAVAEKAMQTEIEELKAKIDEENRVNAEVESFLRTHIEQRQELLQFWIDKHEADVEQKTKELDLLKATKAKDLERLQELTRVYAEYEQVVVEDRIEKEKAKRRLEQEARELAACIKCQAWWRGVMVRRCLGPYKKKKKKGGKGKDDKDKKEKGKK